MAKPEVPVDLRAKLALVHDYWKPHTVAESNGYEIRVAKFKGEFIWHTHTEGDEMFAIVDGRLDIEMRDRETVTLQPGHIFVVPRGLEHRPISPDGCSVVLLEPIGAENTGDRVDHEMTVVSPWL